MTELEWLKIFGDNLKSLLNEYRMTQRELADAAGLAESSISAYINKTKMPGVKALINIADAFNMSLDELIDFGSRIH